MFRAGTRPRASTTLLQLVLAIGTEFQPGAQDDFVDVQSQPKSQLANDRLVAFDTHSMLYHVRDSGTMHRVYESLRLRWPAWRPD